MRFGVWALVHGSRGALQDPEEPYDASWERNLVLVQEAEKLGFDSTLVAQHTINPHHAPNDQLEAWTSSVAIAVPSGWMIAVCPSVSGAGKAFTSIWAKRRAI